MQDKYKDSKTVIGILTGFLVGTLIVSTFLVVNKNRKEEIATTPTPSIASTSESTIEPTSTPTASYTLSIPYAKTNFALSEADNTSGFESGWSIQTSDGNAYSDSSYNTSSINIVNSGSNIDSVIYYRDGIPLEKGCSYLLTFNASSSIDRTIDVQIINADNGNVISSQTYTVTGTESMYSLIFDYDSNTVWNASIRFFVGKSTYIDSATEHTVSLANIRMNSDSTTHAVRINQAGYLSNYQKRCTFIYEAGDFFDVVNADTNAVVYTGAIVYKNQYDKSGEYNSYGDFTSVTEPGNYYIRSQIGVISETFTIVENYDDLANSLLHMLTLQRCGTSLDESIASSLAHDVCHNTLATVYATETEIDVSGGWHDAGDYGRYIETGSKAVSDLLLTYLYEPSAYSDDTNSPDSNNGISDILDEARYELEWMLKMQTADGGVYNTVIPTNMSEIVLPDKDTQDLHILFVESTATADFAGTMALASIAYKDIDSEFAQSCLNAALKANAYLDSHTEVEEHTNPAEFNGGNYRDADDTDARFYTKMALYVSTGDQNYLAEAKALYNEDDSVANGVSWNANGGFGRYLFLTYAQSKIDDPSFYETMKDSLLTEADSILSAVNGNAYGISIYEFAWGSNYDIANNGIILSMAYDMTGDTSYEQAAYQQASYILGDNPLDMCFVTGLGYNSPINIHHRPSKATGTTLKGYLVGGPDSYREDIVTELISSDVVASKVYADDYESYTTNEVSIYWNSSFLHLLARLK